MGVHPPLAKAFDPADVPSQVNKILGEFLSVKAEQASDGRMPLEVTDVLRDFLLTGGKRLRPALCIAGWYAAGGPGDVAPVLSVAASLEMFHAFCLIHDDVMDHSAVRRGRPTVHRALAAHHGHNRSPAVADALGAGAAILLGDLALAWSDELVHTADLTSAQMADVLPLIDTMRTEVMYGQYLDLTTTGQPTDDPDRALTIALYKTAKYTIERPLHIGAALAGADDALRVVLSAYALPIGEAFQLRDDLLGVYGHPARTGKPRTDDLRAGKHTVLIAIALRRADEAQGRLLRELLGNPALEEDGANRLRRVLTATGAPAAVEHLIQARCEQAEQALAQAPFPDSVSRVLRELARHATARTV
ncbi:polyprenyl synthetase family protein [Streptomyces sp. NPDC058620]|uniref:polyprenyl synthetase family protein n=1 Tax=Streptomyces sp. NPDC058620 TaxID=3346560 RepID=UPI003666DC85